MRSVQEYEARDLVDMADVLYLTVEKRGVQRVRDSRTFFSHSKYTLEILPVEIYIDSIHFFRIFVSIISLKDF